jgi:hypothetical protein
MKKPLYNQSDRVLIREGSTILSNAIKLHIERKKIERAIMRSFVGRFIGRLLTKLI